MGQMDPSAVAAFGSIVALSLLRRRDVLGRQLPHHHAPWRSPPKHFRFGGNDFAERWFDHRRSIPADRQVLAPVIEVSSASRRSKRRCSAS
jgi:hypothetical protein